MLREPVSSSNDPPPPGHDYTYTYSAQVTTEPPSMTETTQPPRTTEGYLLTYFISEFDFTAELDGRISL
ncbi:hypothetical protein ON010_g17544 [Phytophthora cinnamomi]|nr:hypothetical protein ON010_g17544 [Phytophthora cinnamomi]